MTPDHGTTCPKCGAQLQPVALDSQTAPWLCAGCARGFWTSELDADSRALYRPTHDDWGLGADRVVRSASIELEIADAEQRGTSLREDQFVHTPTSVLHTLVAMKRLHPTFAKSIEAHLANANPPVKGA